MDPVSRKSEGPKASHVCTLSPRVVRGRWQPAAQWAPAEDEENLTDEILNLVECGAMEDRMETPGKEHMDTQTTEIWRPR